MNSTHPNELKETNPSVRVWCKYKVLLDALILSVKESHDKKAIKTMEIFLEMYISQRNKYGCVDCRKGKNICPHYYGSGNKGYAP